MNPELPFAIDTLPFGRLEPAHATYHSLELPLTGPAVKSRRRYESAATVVMPRPEQIELALAAALEAAAEEEQDENPAAGLRLDRSERAGEEPLPHCMNLESADSMPRVESLLGRPQLISLAGDSQDDLEDPLPAVDSLFGTSTAGALFVRSSAEAADGKTGGSAQSGSSRPLPRLETGPEVLPGSMLHTASTMPRRRASRTPTVALTFSEDSLVPNRLIPLIGMLMILAGLLLVGWNIARALQTDIRPAVEAFVTNPRIPGQSQSADPMRHPGR